MAMTALGMGTRFAKFKGLGLAPIYTAGAMFVITSYSIHYTKLYEC